jgi:hypothetical protein
MKLNTQKKCDSNLHPMLKHVFQPYPFKMPPDPQRLKRVPPMHRKNLTENITRRMGNKS